ncbi:MAG TPA: redoxin family protein [Terriglobia bacterium]|nr:redoxin family protein [Terriglobia bacterium]
MRKAPQKLAVVALAAVGAFATLQAQSLPDAGELRKQTESALGQRRSIQFVREITGEIAIRGKGNPVTEMTVGGRTIPVPSAIGNQTVSVLNPGRARIETQVGSVQTLMVSDGETTWTYRPATRQYSKIAAAPGAGGVAAELNLLDVLAFFEDRKSARTISSETLTLDGRRYDCWVVVSNLRIPPEAAMGGQVSGGVLTSWIDKQLRLPVQETVVYNYRVAPAAGAAPIEYSARIVQMIRALRTDEDLSPELFAFAPPADATEQPALMPTVASNSTPPSAVNSGRVDFTGKDAPTFSLMDLDGKPYSLDSLKGKTVLLDFWATWCGPCKRSLPVLEKLHQQYSPAGLTILGVDVGEDRSTVTTFLKANPMPYPIALGSEFGILTAYSIQVIPTYVLIGPDGKVVAQQFGFNETALNTLAARSGSTSPAAR